MLCDDVVEVDDGEVEREEEAEVVEDVVEVEEEDEVEV